MGPSGIVEVKVITNPLSCFPYCLIILGSMFKKKLVFAFVLNVFLVAIVAGYLVECLVY